MMSTTLRCKTCGGNIALVALARHAQMAHGVDPAKLLELGKGNGLWELDKQYESLPTLPDGEAR